ncbi:MAG: hypothetical protein JWR71_1774 [Pseudarthrobacter sp.]|nr:hypothetical protein [Pseudarthrobacter sp.]
MSDQTTPRPDPQGSGAQGSGDSYGYEPPQFVPPQGSTNPAPPLYDWNQPGAGQYSQPAGQYGAPYAQPGSPYGPPNSYGQPNQYGQPAYYGMPAAEPKGLSITSMVCGISSVLLGWFMIPQVVAIITGHLGLSREPAGKGFSITGLVLGYLCLVGYGAIWLFLIIGLAAYSSSSGYGY